MNALSLRDFIQLDHGGVSNGIKHIIIDFFGDWSKGFVDVGGFGDVVTQFPCALVSVLLVINFVHLILIIIDLSDGIYLFTYRKKYFLSSQTAKPSEYYAS